VTSPAPSAAQRVSSWVRLGPAGRRLWHPQPVIGRIFKFTIGPRAHRIAELVSSARSLVEPIATPHVYGLRTIGLAFLISASTPHAPDR
jgi:hypothetical protein